MAPEAQSRLIGAPGVLAPLITCSVIFVTASFLEKRSMPLRDSYSSTGIAMLKNVVIALALTTLIGAQVKLLPVQWTDACVNSECIVGP
jgi:hypothetical protein